MGRVVSFPPRSRLLRTCKTNAILKEMRRQETRRRLRAVIDAALADETAPALDYTGNPEPKGVA